MDESKKRKIGLALLCAAFALFFASPIVGIVTGVDTAIGIILLPVGFVCLCLGFALSGIASDK